MKFNVVVATHHKTGTVWMSSVFKAVAKKLRANYVDFWENYGKLDPLLKKPFMVFNYDPNFGRANCMDVRYEELFQDRTMALWSSIQSFLGFNESEQTFGKECFWKYSLFGEAPGANRRHARSGEVQQWRHEFSPKLAQAFVDRFPDALQLLGYESDDRWIKHLDQQVSRGD